MPSRRKAARCCCMCGVMQLGGGQARHRDSRGLAAAVKSEYKWLRCCKDSHLCNLRTKAGVERHPNVAGCLESNFVVVDMDSRQGAAPATRLSITGNRANDTDGAMLTTESTPAAAADSPPTTAVAPLAEDTAIDDGDASGTTVGINTTTAVSIAPAATSAHGGPSAPEAAVQGGSNVKTEEWLSVWLGTPIFLGHAAFTLLMIASLVVLCTVSHFKNGLVTVSDHTITFANYQIGISLLWDSGPVLIFQLYMFLVAAVVRALSDRQPYVALKPLPTDDRGAPAQTSILLNYQSFLAVTAPFHAWNNKHFAISLCLLCSLISSLALPAIGAHLFAAAATNVDKKISIEQSFAFEDKGYGDDSSLLPVLDIASSAVLYGGHPLPWTTLTQAFVPATLPGVGQATNYSFNTQALNAALDCRTLSAADFELRKDGPDWAFLAIDRGCQISDYEFTTNPLDRFNVQHVKTYVNISCGYENGIYRIAVVTALNANQSTTVLTNVTAISCIPVYSRSDGVISIAMSPGNSEKPEVDSFVSSNEHTLYDPGFANAILNMLTNPLVVDSRAISQVTVLGRIILECAQLQSREDYFSPDIIHDCFEKIFTTSFAFFVKQFLVKPATAHQIPATQSTLATRLFFVWQLGIPVIVLLCVILAMLIFVRFYARSHPSCLHEEPSTLLHMAALLRNSDVLPATERLAQTSTGKIVEAFRKHPDLSTKGWKFENMDNPKIARIVSTAKARPL